MRLCSLCCLPCYKGFPPPGTAYIGASGCCHLHPHQVSPQHVCGVGHAKIDFTVLRNSSAQLRMWATDLSVGPSLALASFQLFDFLSAGDFAARSGIYAVNSGSSTASSTGDLGPDSLNNEAAMNNHVHVDERCYVSCEMVSIQEQSVGFEGVLQVHIFCKAYSWRISCVCPSSSNSLCTLLRTMSSHPRYILRAMGQDVQQ